MNRKLLALAIGAALAAPLAANAAPTVYGQLNLSVDYVDFDGGPEETTQINSNSSRLGVKGEEKLSSTLNLLYKAEYGVSGDGDGADWSLRDRYIGLANKDIGTVRIGAFDSPFKAAEGSVDQFNDLNNLDMGNFISGQDRLSNVIAYTSPKVADALTFAVALQQGEGADGHGLGDGVSASVAFEQNGMYLAAAVNKDVKDGLHNDKAEARNGIRLVGTFQVEALQLGALLQRTESSDEKCGTCGQADEDALILSAGYKMDKQNTLKAQAGYQRVDFGGGKDKSWQVAAGMDHSLSQATKVFGHAGYGKDEPAGGGADSKGFTVGVGLATVF